MTRPSAPHPNRPRTQRASRQGPRARSRCGARPFGERETATRTVRRLQDSLSQTLFAGSLLAHSLGHLQGPADAARLQDGVAALQRLHCGARAELRLLELEHEPAALTRSSLPGLLKLAVDALAGRGGPKVQATIEHGERRAGARGRHVYRIAQEALANAGRHSGASQVELSWTLAPGGRARLRIADNGHGFDPADGWPRPGLADMQRRATTIGAHLELHTAPGGGCEFILDLPWRQ